MKSLFDPATYHEIVRRLDAINQNSPRQWGKMSPAQMLEHTARALDMAAGNAPVKQAVLGKLIGWIFRSDFLGPKPFAKNMPTGPDFVIRAEPDFDQTKARLQKLLAQFHGLGETGVNGNVHGFFGKLTGAEWGVTQYKHVDHHFRQFGA